MSESKLDISKFEFPEPSICAETDPNLLAEAKLRGFYGGHTKYNDLFCQLFFSGGTLNFKEGLDAGFKSKATVYLKSFMMSFEPKHEEKEAISALLLSELVEA